MLSHIPCGRIQIAHLCTHAYTPRFNIHRIILSIFIPDKDTKYNNKKTHPLFLCQTRRMLASASTRLPLRRRSMLRRSNRGSGRKRPEGLQRLRGYGEKWRLRRSGETWRLRRSEEQQRQRRPGERPRTKRVLGRRQRRSDQRWRSRRKWRHWQLGTSSLSCSHSVRSPHA